MQGVCLSWQEYQTSTAVYQSQLEYWPNMVVCLSLLEYGSSTGVCLSWQEYQTSTAVYQSQLEYGPSMVVCLSQLEYWPSMVFAQHGVLPELAGVWI